MISFRTKAAYIERIERLSSVLTKVKTNINSSKRPPNAASPIPPPLNIRTEPDDRSKIVGQLSNGTLVSVLDYSANGSWAYVGKHEDRFPIGWVFAKYFGLPAGCWHHRQ